MSASRELIERIEDIAERNNRGARDVALNEGGMGTLEGARRVAQEVFSQHAGCEGRNWGSWVPGIPLAQSLVRYPVTIVDLTALSADRLLEQMALSLDQFARLTAEGFLRINLSHYDSERQSDFSGYLADTSVLPSLLRDEAIADSGGIYINSAFREPILAHLAGQPINLEADKNAALERFQIPAKNFADAYESAKAAGGAPPAWQGAIFRGAPPSPIKIAYNYAYLQCSKRLLDPDADSVVAAIVAETADKRLQNPFQFARFAERLEATHKLITAPLTGAYGGTYGMNVEDSAKLSAVIGEQDAGLDIWEHPNIVLESRTRNHWFGILKDIASGRLERFSDNLGAGPGRMSRQIYVWKSETMNDREFDHFMEFLRANREILTENAKIVAEMEAVLESQSQIQQSDVAYFLQAAYNVAEKQGKLLDRKFKDLAEDVVGLVESASDLDPVLSISINLARGVYRYTEDLAVKADRETMQAMQSTADKFATQSRLIVDRQKSWVL